MRLTVLDVANWFVVVRVKRPFVEGSAACVVAATLIVPVSLSVIVIVAVSFGLAATEYPVPAFRVMMTVSEPSPLESSETVTGIVTVDWLAGKVTVEAMLE